MNQVYFVVKMTFDQNGKPIEGTEQYVSALTDGVVIQAAEEAHKIHISRGRTTDDDIIEDAAKRVRPTVSQFPAVQV